MALPSSGQISFAQLAAELGNSCSNVSLRSYSACANLSTPDGINELYGCQCVPIYGTGVWSTGGNTIVRRNFYGMSGTQNSGLIFGGYCSGNRWCTEEYNGTSWATGPAYYAYASAGAGSQNATVGFGGVCPGDGQPLNRTCEYNGSTWSSSNGMNRSAGYVGGTGTQNSAIALNGYLSAYNASSCTEEYNGSTWATANATPSNIYQPKSAGYQNAALSYKETIALEYNGTNWSSTNCLSVCRSVGSGLGIQNDAIAAGGDYICRSCTEEYNGSTWSTGNALSTGRSFLGTGSNSDPGSGFLGPGQISNSYSNTVACTEEYTRPITGKCLG